MPFASSLSSRAACWLDWSHVCLSPRVCLFERRVSFTGVMCAFRLEFVFSSGVLALRSHVCLSPRVCLLKRRVGFLLVGSYLSVSFASSFVPFFMFIPWIFGCFVFYRLSCYYALFVVASIFGPHFLLQQSDVI